MKLVYQILLVLFTFTTAHTYAQEDMFRKERKRTWRKWRKNRQSYNPYLDKKAKNKPSAKLAKANKKDIRKKDKAVRKQKKRIQGKKPKR